MTTEAKISAIKSAIERAKNNESKMDQTAWSVPALSSLKIRHLMNNLGAISTRYFECGVHKGGLFCSTIRNNENLFRAEANDNFASDHISNEDVSGQFMQNMASCKAPHTLFSISIGDTFQIPLSTIGPNIDLYLFDADHSYESQRKAMTHFLPAMADTFIVCVDDYDWKEVKEGTQDGIGDSGCEILFEEVWEGNDHDNDGAWNGFYIGLLRKR